MFCYEPATGTLRWRWRPEMTPQWNGRYAGAIAGSIKDRDDGTQVRITTIDKMYLVYVHRIAWCMMVGYWPSALIDHRDGDKRNNRWSNIRLASRNHNQWNRRKIQGSVYIKGVTYLKRGRKYRARIWRNGRREHLGSPQTAFEGGLLYDKYARKYYGEYAATNADCHPILLYRLIFHAFALD